MPATRNNSNLTPEQRSERGRKAGLARWAKERAAEHAAVTAYTQRRAKVVAAPTPPPEPKPAPKPKPPPPEPHTELQDFVSDVVISVTGLADQGFSFLEYVPARLRERFTAATSNGDKLSNSQQIALVDLRITQLLERVDTAESGHRWREVKAAMRDLTVAMRSGDETQVAEAYTALNVSVNRGVNDADNWLEIMQSIEVRRRVTETELKRIKAAEEFMSAHEALALIQVISESVNRHVADPVAKTQIAADISRAIGGPGH